MKWISVVLTSIIAVFVWSAGFAMVDRQEYWLEWSRGRSSDATYKTFFEDTDEDGLSNKEEIGIFDTDPTNPDTDGDGFNDLSEIANCYMPNQAGVSTGKADNAKIWKWRLRGELVGFDYNTTRMVNGLYLNKACDYYNDKAVMPLFR